MIAASSLQPIAVEAESSIVSLGKLAMLGGVNLSGAEFNSDVIPGVVGTNYFFPNLQELAYYAGKGVNVVRLPFLWERIQPVIGGPLDPDHVAWINSFIGYSPSITIVLDCHNYGSAFGGQIGSSPTNVQFAAFWALLSTTFSAPNIVYGLMNEPRLTSVQWIAAATAAISSIRQTGSMNKISIADIGPNVLFEDPNYEIEAHIYFDANNSGTSSLAVSDTIGIERITQVTAWARENGVRLYLGEFGAANNPTMLAALSNTISYLQQNADIWSCWTYWSGGPSWGSYMYSIEPKNLGLPTQTDSAQMTALVSYL
jgi:endoglucanase